jgi:cAMP phosphodiesterase
LSKVSYSNAQPDILLFGYLTPRHLLEELERSAALLPAGTMKDFAIVVTHMKPAPRRIEAIMKTLPKEINVRSGWSIRNRDKNSASDSRDRHDIHDVFY